MQAVDTILSHLESATDGMVHILTPSPIYFCANSMAETVNAKSLSRDLKDAIAVLEKRADQFKRAVVKFPGVVHLVVPEHRSRRFDEVWEQRRRRLDGDLTLHKKYMPLCRSVVKEIVRSRREAGRATVVHEMMAFSRVRVLLLGDVCFAQEIPADRHGVLGEMRTLERNLPGGRGPNPAFQRVNSIVAAYEVDLDNPE